MSTFVIFRMHLLSSHCVVLKSVIGFELRPRQFVTDLFVFAVPGLSPDLESNTGRQMVKNSLQNEKEWRKWVHFFKFLSFTISEFKIMHSGMCIGILFPLSSYETFRRLVLNEFLVFFLHYFQVESRNFVINQRRQQFRIQVGVKIYMYFLICD